MGKCGMPGEHKEKRSHGAHCTWENMEHGGSEGVSDSGLGKGRGERVSHPKIYISAKKILIKAIFLFKKLMWSGKIISRINNKRKIYLLGFLLLGRNTMTMANSMNKNI